MCARRAPLRGGTSPSVICKCKRREGAACSAPAPHRWRKSREGCTDSTKQPHSHANKHLCGLQRRHSRHMAAMSAPRGKHTTLRSGTMPPETERKTLTITNDRRSGTLTITNDSYSYAENAPVALSHTGSRSPLRADLFHRAATPRTSACLHEKGETSHRLPPLLKLLAEGEGFKPPIPVMGIPDFESSAFGHSANLPLSPWAPPIRKPPLGF